MHHCIFSLLLAPFPTRYQLSQPHEERRHTITITTGEYDPVSTCHFADSILTFSLGILISHLIFFFFFTLDNQDSLVLEYSFNLYMFVVLKSEKRKFRNSASFVLCTTGYILY